MKKVLKIIAMLVLVISILITAVIVFGNLSAIIRIMFFGITVGSDNLDSIWWGKTTLYGISGIKRYYKVYGELVYIFELPITIVCLIYQFIYFKIIRKNKNLKINK